MAIALFRKQPEAPAQPHGDSLREHLRVSADLSRRQQIAVAKSTSARADVDAAAAAQAKVERLRSEMDQLLGDARYSGQPLPDITAQQRGLLDAEKEAARLAIVGRAAGSAAHRFAADFEALAAKYREHAKALPGLLHAATVEQMANLSQEFREAEEAFRAVHAKVFAHVTLADQLAIANHLGEFYGQRAFGELFISRPQHDAFHRGPTDPWQAKLNRDEEARAVEEAAEGLSRALLAQLPGD